MSGLRVTVGLALLLAGGRAQDANCDFYRNVDPGVVVSGASRGYPGSYAAGSQCRWQYAVPAGYRCRVDFTEINLPKAADGSCSVDQLLVSRTGDPQLTGAEYYCGQGTLSNVLSSGSRISFALITSARSPGGRLAWEVRAVADTTSATCSCGLKKVNRIVGGTETQPNEFPMMAGIVYVEESAIKCGATIVSQQYVVTAAHCVATRTTANTAVIVGEHDVSTGSDTSATQAFKIQSITLHPQYSSTNYKNDIAMVKIQGTMTFSEAVGPVCLPYKYVGANLAGARVEMLGWGTTFYGGPKSRVLRKVTVDCISQAQCQPYVPSLTDNQICTLTPGKDSCQDDSGGPVLYTEPSTGRLVLFGLISFGQECASNKPGVNTRVSAYLNWMESVTNVNFCKNY